MGLDLSWISVQKIQNPRANFSLFLFFSNLMADHAYLTPMADVPTHDDHSIDTSWRAPKFRFPYSRTFSSEYICKCQEGKAKQSKASHLSDFIKLLMGLLVVNLPEEEMDHRRSQSSSTKVERRIIEKNRRNQMKVLYSRLNSLLPNPDSKVRTHDLSPFLSTKHP